MVSKFRLRLRSALAPDYELGPELPGAGMSRVFRARDMTLGRQVALKIVHPDIAAVVGVEHFRQEIAVVSRLLHPHIVPLLAAGDVDGLFYYTMPLVTGESLRSRMEREGRLPVEEAVRLAREIASALDYAHRQGVVHRDIKPENVLLHDGHAMVLDFGIATALTQAGRSPSWLGAGVTGTPHYMAPEQSNGGTADARSDIYALGRMLAEMLTGRLPSARRLDRRGIPGLRRGLAYAVERAIAVEADARYPTAAEFRAALEPYLLAWWEQFCPMIRRVGKALRRQGAITASAIAP